MKTVSTCDEIHKIVWTATMAYEIHIYGDFVLRIEHWWPR